MFTVPGRNTLANMIGLPEDFPLIQVALTVIFLILFLICVRLVVCIAPLVVSVDTRDYLIRSGVSLLEYTDIHRRLVSFFVHRIQLYSVLFNDWSTRWNETFKQKLKPTAGNENNIEFEYADGVEEEKSFTVGDDPSALPATGIARPTYNAAIRSPTTLRFRTMRLSA